jgi:hypothetical protein
MKEPFMQVFARIGHPDQPVKVFVVASSRSLNEAIAQSAAEALLGDQASAYVFPWVPAVDARDRLPVTELMQADFVLVALPAQTDLSTGFKGLDRVLAMFAYHDPAARDFTLLGEPVAFPKFSLAVYRRIQQSTDRTAIAALEELQAAVGRRGFTQPSWVEIGQTKAGGTVEVWANDAVVAQDRDQRGGWPARFLSYDKVDGAAELAGDGETTCPEGAMLTLRADPQDAGAEPIVVSTGRLESGANPHAFLIKLSAPAVASHVALEIDAPGSTSPCNVILRHLQLRTVNWMARSGGNANTGRTTMGDIR